MAKAGQPAAAPIISSSGSGMCIAAGCKNSANRAEFCTQHFSWFKLGLITKRGEKAKDFDKKHAQVSNKKSDLTI